VINLRNDLCPQGSHAGGGVASYLGGEGGRKSGRRKKLKMTSCLETLRLIACTSTFLFSPTPLSCDFG